MQKELTHEFARYKWDILRLAEVSWPEWDHHEGGHGGLKEGHKILYISNDNNHQHGVSRLHCEHGESEFQREVDYQSMKQHQQRHERGQQQDCVWHWKCNQQHSKEEPVGQEWLLSYQWDRFWEDGLSSAKNFIITSWDQTPGSWTIYPTPTGRRHVPILQTQVEEAHPSWTPEARRPTTTICQRIW